MKNISSGLLDTITNGGQLNAIIKITRTDGEHVFLTDYDKDITIDGDTYVPGYQRTALASTDGLNVNRFDVEGFFDDALLGASDLRLGKYDDARVQVAFLDPSNLSHGKLLMPAGIFGQIELKTPTQYKIELSSLTQLYAQPYGQLYAPTCRAHLFDGRCKLERTFVTGAVDTVITERRKFTATGTFAPNTLLAVPNWQPRHLYYARQSVKPTSPNGFRYVARTSGKSDHPSSKEPHWPTTEGDLIADYEVLWQAVKDDYYRYGRLVFTSGDNVGQGLEVKEYDGTNTFTLFLPTNHTIAPGDSFELEPGDDKEAVTCRFKFGNLLNFRGEPHVLGERKSLLTPDSTKA